MPSAPDDPPAAPPGRTGDSAGSEQVLDRVTGRDRLADELGVPGTERLLALSDGVVAIALTLLVLELVVPVVHGEGADKAYVLWDRLYAEKDRLVAYVVSFYVIATFWLVHHRTYRLIRGHSESVAWWNFAYLFTITLIPFSSGLLGSDGQNPVAVAVFAGNLLLCSLATTIVFNAARRDGLLVDVVSPVTLRVYRIRSLFIMGVLAVSVAVAFVAPGVAPYLWFGMIAARLVEPRVVRRARPEDFVPLAATRGGDAPTHEGTLPAPD